MPLKPFCKVMYCWCTFLSPEFLMIIGCDINVILLYMIKTLMFFRSENTESLLHNVLFHLELNKCFQENKVNEKVSVQEFF